MNGKELIETIGEEYGVDPEYPWDDENAIFRHRENRKWFAVLLVVSCRRLGIEREGSLEVANLKCPPQLAGAYRSQPGFLPAYHMNKEHWISALLDGSAEDAALKELLEISYRITRAKRRPRPKREEACETPTR